MTLPFLKQHLRIEKENYNKLSILKGGTMFYYWIIGTIIFIILAIVTIVSIRHEGYDFLDVATVLIFFGIISYLWCYSIPIIYFCFLLKFLYDKYIK